MHVQTTEPVAPAPRQVVVSSELEQPVAEEAPKEIIPAGPVPIYFNAKDVKIEREKELLKQYLCVDGKPADGIGLEIVKDGRLGVAFWRSEPTEKDPKAGHWEHHCNLFPAQLYDFHECFRQYDLMASMQKTLQKTAKQLESRGKKGIALMIDDKFRHQFSQLSHMQLKVNDTFRKIWFKKNRRP